MSTPPRLAARSRRRAAFTLIELLTVLAVIGILAAILIPTVSRVRASAQAAKCSAQTRTLALAHRLYRQDNKGEAPPLTVEKGDPRVEGGGKIYGLLLLRAYYRARSPYIYTSSPTAFIVEPTEICPASSSTGLTTNPERGGPDYGALTRSVVQYDRFYHTPSRTPLIWDGWNPAWNSDRTLPLRHGGAVNVAFLDGHVERIPQSDGRLYSGWWNHALTREQPSDSQLNQGKPLGSLTPDA